jgi:hypothetical protein
MCLRDKGVNERPQSLFPPSENGIAAPLSFAQRKLSRPAA